MVRADRSCRFLVVGLELACCPLYGFAGVLSCGKKEGITFSAVVAGFISYKSLRLLGPLLWRCAHVLWLLNFWHCSASSGDPVGFFAGFQ